MNYYHDELYETFDENSLKGKTEEHEKQKDNVEGFSITKEMFLKALGLNINVGDKRNKQNVVKPKNNLENNKMTVSHPATLQKIGNINKEDDNEVLNDFGDDFNIAPLQSKTYICGCCSNKFEDKNSIISHLISHKFIRNAKINGLRPLVKRTEEKIKSNDRSTKHIGNIAKKTTKKTKAAKNTRIRLCDEDNVTTNHEATKVPVNDLAISDNRQNMKIFHNEFGVTDNFKDSNDDCPINLAEDFDIKENRVDPERNFICQKNSLMIHLLADKYMIVKKSRVIINDTKQKLKKNEIVKAHDLKPKCETEEKEQHKIPDIHKQRDSNESRIIKQARVLITRMHLAAHELINDTIIRESKTTTDKETIQEHKDIETLNEPKANEDGKNIRQDSEDRNSNDRHNEQTNIMTTRAQMKNYGNIRNSNKKTTTNNCGFKGNHCGRKLKTKASLNTRIIRNSNNSTAIAKNKEITLKAHTEPMNNSKECSRKLKGAGITLKFPIIQLERCNLTKQLEKNTKKTKFCTLCKYRTPYASRLARHTRVHTNSYRCEQCRKEFRRNNDLKVHLRTHSGDKPFRCQCGSTFAKMNTLNRHLKTHTREKSYKCNLCTSQFKFLSGLKRHLKIHEDNTYKCTTCASSFSDGSSLKRHIRRHYVLKKPYSCERCKYSSAHSYDLKRHVKSCEGLI